MNSIAEPRTKRPQALPDPDPAMKPSVLNLMLISAAIFTLQPSAAENETASHVLIETIFPHSWVQELIHHPLRVSFFLPDPEGGIHHGDHRFSDMPHTLPDKLADVASTTLGNPSAYVAKRPLTEPKLPHPDALLRFENEQQTIDFIVSLTSATLFTYIDGQLSPNASSPIIFLSPKASDIIRQLHKDQFAPP
jgi:hypothetical protein